MKQRLGRGPIGFACAAFVIGLAAITSSQSVAQTVPPAQKSPAPVAPTMPMPAGSPMPMPGATMKPMMPATDTAAPATQNGQPFNALHNNPNGPGWVVKFDRHPSGSSMSSGSNMPMKRSMMMKSMMKSKMMKCTMMKSKMKHSASHKPMGSM